jgi:hypothetical protein
MGLAIDRHGVVRGRLAPPVAARDVPALARAAEEAARVAMTPADELLASLSAEAAERGRALTEATAQLHHLEARLILRELLPDVRGHVEREKWASHGATLIASRFPALLRSLNEEAKVASEGC